jgi:hypothetical protein
VELSGAFGQIDLLLLQGQSLEPVLKKKINSEVVEEEDEIEQGEEGQKEEEEEEGEKEEEGEEEYCQGC